MTPAELGCRHHARPRAWFFMPVRGADFMVQIDTFNLFGLGQVLMRLKSLEADSHLHEWRASLDDAEEWLLAFLHSDETYGTVWKGVRIDISHSKQAGDELIFTIGDSAGVVAQEQRKESAPRALLAKIERTYNGELSKLIAPLRNRVRVFETNLAAELGDSPTYFIAQVGMFSTKDLLSESHKKLSKSASKKCPPFVVTDIGRSGSCLALHQFTASGFHAIRAVEYVAREYSRAIVKSPKHTKPDLTLGLVIDNLREQLKLEEKVEHSDSPLGLIVAYMVRVKNIFRNPIMHPEMALERDEAEEVFDLAFLIINAISRDLDIRSVGKAVSLPWKHSLRTLSIKLNSSRLLKRNANSSR